MTVSPLQQIEADVLEQANRIRLDLDDDDARPQLRRLIDDAVAEWSERYRRGQRPFDLADPEMVAERAERNLLGAMLLSKEAISATATMLRPDDFYKPAHAHVYDAVLSLDAAGEPADPVTVADEAADALISAGLRATFPDIALITEEQADTHDLDVRDFLIVDPLDGT